MSSFLKSVEEAKRRGYMISTMIFPSRTSWFIHASGGVVAHGDSDTEDQAGEEMLCVLARALTYGGEE